MLNNNQEVIMDYEKNCHLMAKMAQNAYLDGDEARPRFKSLGFNNHKFIDIDGAQCHIVWNKDTYVICFRGTEPSEFSDITADLNAFPDKAQNGHGLVHNGFQEEVNKLWDSITPHLDKAKGKNFFITGHSLGGAMATIATSRLADSVTALYTYGSPRAGTKSFVKSFAHIPHYRHVNNNDIVPKVPFAIMGYRHHCAPRYINYYGNIRPSTYWQRVKDQWRGRWQALRKGVPFDGAYDHSMVYYVKYTEQNQ
jgi:triacylglycerol lipase